MLGRVTEANAPYELAGFGRWKHFVESSRRVRVEVVADQNHFFAFGIAILQKGGHFLRPVKLRSLLAGKRTALAKMSIALAICKVLPSLRDCRPT